MCDTILRFVLQPPDVSRIWERYAVTRILYSCHPAFLCLILVGYLHGDVA